MKYQVSIQIKHVDGKYEYDIPHDKDDEITGMKKSQGFWLIDESPIDTWIPYHQIEHIQFKRVG